MKIWWLVAFGAALVPTVRRRDLAGLAAGLVVAPANAADVRVEFGPDPSGAMTGSTSFSVPAEWKLLSDSANENLGGRRLVVYSDPDNTDINCFVLITPVRGDYTSLGSFGTLDAVQDTVIPKGAGIESDLISSASSAGRYTYEYTISVPEQPKRHLTTVFSLLNDNIVSFNVQSRETDFSPDVAKTLGSIVNTFAIKKL